MRRVLIVIAVMLLTACRVDTTVDISMHSDGSGNDHPDRDRRCRCRRQGSRARRRPAVRRCRDGRLDGDRADRNRRRRPAGGAHPRIRESRRRQRRCCNRSMVRAGRCTAWCSARSLDEAGTTDLAGRVAADRRPRGVRRSRRARRGRRDAVCGGGRRRRSGPHPGSRRDGASIAAGQDHLGDGHGAATAPCRGSCRSTGRSSISATSAVDDHGTAKVWGIASSAALVAMVLWCVVGGRVHLLGRHASASAEPHIATVHGSCNTPSLG